MLLNGCPAAPRTCKHSKHSCTPASAAPDKITAASLRQTELAQRIDGVLNTVWARRAGAMPGTGRGCAGRIDAAGVGAGGLRATPLRPRRGPGHESELRIVLGDRNSVPQDLCPEVAPGPQSRTGATPIHACTSATRAQSALYLWYERWFSSSPSRHTRTYLTQGCSCSARCCKALGHGKSRPCQAPIRCFGASSTPCCLTAARPCAQPPGLAQQLRLQPKLLRQTLRYFESELLVRREHRQEKATRRKRRGDLLPDAGAQP